MTTEDDLRRPPTRRSRAVNFGDRTLLRSSAPRQQLAWVSVEQAQSFIVYAQAQVVQPPPGTESPLVVPFVELEWGHGGASVFATFPVLPSAAVQPGNVLRVPLAASMIKVSGVLLDEGGNEIDPTNPATAQVACVVAPGFDGIPQVPTEWIPVSGSNASVTGRPSKITRFFGYRISGTAPLWAMLIDQASTPGNGAPPVLAAPVGLFPAVFDVPTPNGMPFSQGIWLALSSRPDALELASGASVLARIERQLL